MKVLTNTQGERSKRWRATPRGCYSEQKRKARQRGVAFRLSFDQWWKIWEDSGHWDERGNHHGCYCMYRPDDTSAYHIGNAAIGPFAKNADSGVS